MQEINPYRNLNYADIFATRWPQVTAAHFVNGQRDATVLKAALNDTVYIPTREFCFNNNIVDICPFYYFDYLELEREDFVLDLGCGVNAFQPWIANLKGLDADPQANADIHDHFDVDYAQGHCGIWSKIIAINSVHFAPITAVAQQISLVKTLLCKGGRAFVSTNLETWLMHTDRAVVTALFGAYPRFDDVVAYIDQQIQQLDLELLVYDWPVLYTTAESSIRDDYNGNIRIVFEN